MAKVRHRATALNRRPLRRRLSSWKWHRLRHRADVRCWHLADMTRAVRDVRFRG
jgi:hypothetical protein